MSETSEDYVTVEPTYNPRWFVVIVMKYHARDDQYIQSRVSQPLSRVAADALAQSWATAMQLEVR